MKKILLTFICILNLNVSCMGQVVDLDDSTLPSLLEDPKCHKLFNLIIDFRFDEALEFLNSNPSINFSFGDLEHDNCNLLCYLLENFGTYFSRSSIPKVPYTSNEMYPRFRLVDQDKFDRYDDLVKNEAKFKLLFEVLIDRNGLENNIKIYEILVGQYGKNLGIHLCICQTCSPNLSFDKIVKLLKMKLKKDIITSLKTGKFEIGNLLPDLIAIIASYVGDDLGPEESNQVLTTISPILPNAIYQQPNANQNCCTIS